MDISTIKQKIAALEAEIVPNSVSPERVASILSDITSLVENMGYLGYEFLGVATPTASPSFDKDLTAKKYFYFAVQQGTYANFGGLSVGANDGLTILAYNGTWTKTATGTAMKTDITSLKTSVTNINTKILPLSVSFDLDKIDALTDSSGSTDIKEAFTPLSGIGVAPVAGNILRSGNVIKNSQEVTVIWSDYDSKTAYYSFSYVIDNVLKIFQTDTKTFVRVAKTIVGGDVRAEIEDLQDRVSIGKAPVWITMTLESEPHDPTRDNIGDIIFFEEGNYLKEVVRSATGRITLGQAVNMETGRLYVYGDNLCKWEDGDFVPFYLDDINTLKSKARYEYSLSKIIALTDTSEESAVEEAFTPTYAPEGNLAPRVPKAGDLLIDGNNTVVVSEGTQIFFSFTYQEEIISMRVYSGGSSFQFNVWKFPAGTVYDFNSIDTLTESSTADDIKKALTPKIGDGMRIPNSGDIMLIGIEENPDTVSVLYRYRNTFAYYHNRLLTTIEVEGEDDSLRVVKTISRNYVYDFDKINALTNASTFSDIMHAFSPLIIGTEGHIPKTGDLLTSGYDEEGNAVRSAKVICHNGNSFAYCYGGKHVTVELVGDFLGSPDMKIEKTVTDLEGSDVEFSLQLHNGDLLAICKEGEILPSDEIHFYRRGRYSTNLHSDISSRYRNRKDGWRNSNYSGGVDIDQVYETYIPYEFDKEKLEQGVNGNPKLIGMDVWKLTAVEDQSVFADPFPALFRSAMVRLYTDPNAPSGWEVCIRDGRNGKSYDWYDYQKFMPYPNMEIRKTVHAGVAVHRNNRRISDIVPFKIRFHLINDGTLSEEVPPTIDDNYVRVTLRI